MIPFERNAAGIVEPARNLKVDGEYDVVVVGAGPAGCGAAIAAGRAGLKTLVIEATSALGGLATMGLVNIPLDYVSGIGQEMFTNLKAVNGLWHRNSDPEQHKFVLDRMVRAAGCDVLLVTRVVDALVDGDGICGVVVENKSGRQAITAKRVIDCSGDGDVSALAGAEWKSGRATDGYNQAASLEFRIGGADWDTYQGWKANDPKWIEAIKVALANGDLPYEIDNHLNWITHIPGRPQHCGKDEVSVCMAHSRNCNTLDAHDLTRMYFEGREQADILSKFMKKHIPGFENSWLIDTAPLLGVRDGRRIIGQYVLTSADIASLRKFDDVITISYHGYDIHNPTGPGNIKWVKMNVDGETRYVICNQGGYGATVEPPCSVDEMTNYWGTKEFATRDWYDIPYRTLVPVKVNNLLVAGRCISSDFEAQSGIRLIMACMTTGQAAGTAAGLSLKQGIQPRELEVGLLQKTLKDAGCNLGQANGTASWNRGES